MQLTIQKPTYQTKTFCQQHFKTVANVTVTLHGAKLPNSRNNTNVCESYLYCNKANFCIYNIWYISSNQFSSNLIHRPFVLVRVIFSFNNFSCRTFSSLCIFLILSSSCIHWTSSLNCSVLRSSIFSKFEFLSIVENVSIFLDVIKCNLRSICLAAVPRLVMVHNFWIGPRWNTTSMDSCPDVPEKVQL